LALAGAAARLRAQLGLRLSSIEAAQLERALAPARSAGGGLSAEAQAAAWRQGEAMSLEQAVAFALLERGRAAASLQGLAGLPAPLSPRECEVAALVARGRSNRQIAAELSIAERTAENHVEHILTKLGFRSRAQVAAWAVEHCLAAAEQPA
jgi:non-specific serine/threonine protein kinase